MAPDAVVVVAALVVVVDALVVVVEALAVVVVLVVVVVALVVVVTATPIQFPTVQQNQSETQRLRDDFTIDGVAGGVDIALQRGRTAT